MSNEDDKKEKRREADRRYREAYPDRIAEARRRWSEANPEKAKEVRRRWRKANPEKEARASRRRREANREKFIEAARRWREATPEKVAEYDRWYKEKNREKLAERSRQYHKANPEKGVADNRRRRARKVGNGGSHTEAEWQALVSYYMDQCLCCGEIPDKLTRDHIVPLVKGGTDNIDNIQPLCKSCNDRKGVRVIDYRLDSASSVEDVERALNQ